MSRSFSLPIADPSQIGEARRVASNLARELKFNETDAGKAGIIVTEAASNLLKHSKNGCLVLRPLCQNEKNGLEVLTFDRGPGIPDVQRSLQDGYSTAGTSGNGLGSIKRLSSVFDLYSTSQGTVLLSQLWPGNFIPALQIGALCLAYPGETACGDAWTFREKENGYSFVLADGLGHGLHASEASIEAVRIFREYANEAPSFLLQRMHQAMRATRGAAVMIFDVDAKTRQIRCSGAGNIAGSIVEGRNTRSMVSQNGTVGHQVAKFQQFDYPWPASSYLVLHSDGIQTRWKLDAYPGILSRHPALIAAILCRDFRRERDDATVVVLRETTNPL